MEPIELSRRFWWGAWVFEAAACGASSWLVGDLPGARPLCALLTVLALMGTVGLVVSAERGKRDDLRVCTRELPLVHTVLLVAAALLVLA